MNEGKLDGKQALPAKAVAAITRGHMDIPGSTSKYGYGLTISTTHGERYWFHTGSRAGYGSFIAMFPDRQTSVIVLCNRTGEDLPLTVAKIFEMLGTVPAKVEPANSASAIPAKELELYVGKYQNEGRTIELQVRDGRLWIGQEEVFRNSDGTLITRDADGKITRRMVAVPGKEGKIEYLHSGGRSAARI